MLALPIDRTAIMGVLNVTPDSFSDGGKYVDVRQAVAHAQQMIAEGADSIDVGGESSRPGAAAVSVEEECARVVPVIEELVRADVSIPLSIDTYKPAVARAALDAGASWVNDITGMSDSLMLQLVAERSVPIIIMHMQGTPQTMQEKPQYTDVVKDICIFFQERITKATQAGVQKENIILDPGIGFGKTLKHNLEIFQRMHEFVDLGFPVLVGASRKSFIEKITGSTVPIEKRLEGTIAAHVSAVLAGVRIVRVHDVTAHKRALSVIDAIQHL